MLKAIFLTGIIIYVLRYLIIYVLKVDLERQFTKQPLRVWDMITVGSHIFFALFSLYYLIYTFKLTIYYYNEKSNLIQ